MAFENAGKRFGAVRALARVTIEARSGTVHAITGENGAGKSTLMKALAGVLRLDEGAIWLRGAPARFNGPDEALSAGVSSVFQELSLLPNLTIYENMFLGREIRRRGFLVRGEMRERAAAILETLGIKRSVDQLCGELSVSEQQMIEIAKGIAFKASVFIFDEPTAALNRPEVEKLEALLKDLKSSNKLIFYISHRLEEIFRYCDLVTVLKDGEHVATRTTTELDEQTLVTLMVGRTVDQLFPPRKTRPKGETIALRVRDLVVAEGGPATSFEVRRGEILGLCGLEGQGQRDIVRAIAGLLPRISGIIEYAPSGKEFTRLRSSAVSTIASGIGLVPEDRKAEGLYLPLDIARNVGLGQLRAMSLWKRAHTDLEPIRKLTDSVRIHAANLGQQVGSLSGGNQQKVMMARWLASGVELLLVEEPTRGVDVGAKGEIYGLLRSFADNGGAIVMTSSELTEHLNLCDRIMVVRQGNIVVEIDHRDASEATIMSYALTGRRPEGLNQTT